MRKRFVEDPRNIWFAWYPVYVKDVNGGGVTRVWLERVKRYWVYDGCLYEWKYKLIEDEK